MIRIQKRRSLSQMNKDPLIQELYRKKMTSPYHHNKHAYYSIEQGIQKVLMEEFAFHTEAVRAYPTIEKTFPDNKKCGLNEILLFPVEMGYMPFPYSSPYKKIISYGMKKLAENGLWDHQNKVWRPARPTCASSNADVISVGLVSLTPAYILLGCGGVLSLIILLLEIVSYKRMKNKGVIFMKTEESARIKNENRWTN
uniref:Uncharacterized protein n=1 Tax=Timema bartmani TaxID=61472 RepID=A0A7R9ESN3_9NEOP|nr:unnamed protein product [Timema bartmani]